MLLHILQRLQSASKISTMIRKPPKDPLIVILGATGTGKSDLAIDIATRFNGEIINGDAMQMYDGLPIITNKITTVEQRGIPHHLLGFVGLEEEYWRVGKFKKEAERVMREIRGRGRVPVVVGGTHYYTQSLLFNDVLVDGEHGEKNEGSEEENEEEGGRGKFEVLEGSTEGMLERLREVDPVMAEWWHPNERRKIRRSLEIYLATGKRASEIYEEQKQRKAASTIKEEDVQSPVVSGSTLLIWVHTDPEILQKRLDARIEKMVGAGLLDEVKSLNAFLGQRKAAGASVDLTRGIWVSIGWKEFKQYLAALKSTESSPKEIKRLYDLSIEQTKSATRQYAKRQVRWIRLKLSLALSEAGQLDKLYLVDSSDAAQWESRVSAPTIDITAKFLDGGEMPNPREICTAAEQMLSLREVTEKIRDLGFRRECKSCHVTAVYEHQWEAHLSSRRHRALTKKLLKNSTNGRSRLTTTKNNDTPASDETWIA